jgi:fructoselysine-6-P-deglycase FrlB-like protein
MPFTASTLYKVAGANPGLHLYKTADAIATVVASGYFSTVTDNLRQHDVILVVSETGGTPKVDVVAVTSADGAATVTTTATEGSTAT